MQQELNLPIAQQQPREINKQQLKEIILQFQNDDEKGYYNFGEWKQLHHELFLLDEQNLPQTVINLWRVLKLINFGDDFIPTGLIYDTLVTLMMMSNKQDNQEEKMKVNQEVQYILKTIFFKFIEFNGKYLTDKEKDELSFFKVIKPITEGYHKIITTQFHKQQEAEKDRSLSMSRNEQLYKMYDVFVYKKNLSKLKKIQEEFKQCTFQPDLSYTAHSMVFTQSKYHKIPKKKEVKQISDEIIPEQDEQPLFKAQPIPSYPEVAPNGLHEHLERMQKSREIKRINSLRHLPSLHTIQDRNIKEFGIDERDRARRKKMVKMYEILFMVKVEVGKREYGVKVREGMTIDDVVKAIEMMVGFSHPDIPEIVKGYFMNWQQKVKPSPL